MFVLDYILILLIHLYTLLDGLGYIQEEDRIREGRHREESLL
jgi:hypothetical protein